MDGFNDYGERVIDYIENTIFQTVAPPEEVAAVLVEAIQGEGGYIVPTPGFFPALRALCDRHGILLIIDEVQAGVVGLAIWWAIEHFGVCRILSLVRKACQRNAARCDDRQEKHHDLGTPPHMAIPLAVIPCVVRLPWRHSA